MLLLKTNLFVPGPERAQALPFFHAFTGCDVVSAFNGKGKKSAFEVWNAFPEATAGFLAALRGDVDTGFPAVEKFVVALYDRTSDSTDVNECRRKLFTRKARPLESIPPTRDALFQHCLRAVFQGGFVWGQCLKTTQELPNPEKWGWRRSDEDLETCWEPTWTTQPPVQESLLILIKCGCKQGCKGRCKCRQSQLPCTELCECGGDCSAEEF